MKVILKNQWFTPAGYRIRVTGEVIDIPDTFADTLPKSAQVIEPPDPKNPVAVPSVNSADAVREKMFGADPARQAAMAEEKILNESRAKLVADREALDARSAKDADEFAEFQAWKLAKETQVPADAGEAEPEETEPEGASEVEPEEVEPEPEGSEEPEETEPEGAPEGEPGGPSDGATATNVAKAKRRVTKNAHTRRS